MKKLIKDITFIFLGLAALSINLASSMNPQVYGHDLNTSKILISEIAYSGTLSQNDCRISGTFGCSHDKWIEIYNSSNDSVDLSNYRIGVGKRGGDFAYTQSLSGIINPNSYLTIKNQNVSQSNLPVADLEMKNLVFLSNSQPGSRYIKAAILDQNNNILNLRELGNEEIGNLEKQSNIIQSANSKYSMEFSNVAKINTQNVYKQDGEIKNYGSPGFAPLATLRQNKPLSTEVQTVLIPHVITPAKQVPISNEPVKLPSKPEVLPKVQVTQPAPAPANTQTIIPNSDNKVASEALITPISQAKQELNIKTNSKSATTINSVQPLSKTSTIATSNTLDPQNNHQRLSQTEEPQSLAASNQNQVNANLTLQKNGERQNSKSEITFADKTFVILACLLSSAVLRFLISEINSIVLRNNWIHKFSKQF